MNGSSVKHSCKQDCGSVHVQWDHAFRLAGLPNSHQKRNDMPTEAAECAAR
jgi:hypothetical protein